jgi:hypothetical protein
LTLIKKQLDSVNFNNSSQLVDDLSVSQSMNDKQYFDGRVSTSPSIRVMTTPINKRYLSNDGIKSAPRNLAGNINDVNYVWAILLGATANTIGNLILYRAIYNRSGFLNDKIQILKTTLDEEITEIKEELF